MKKLISLWTLLLLCVFLYAQEETDGPTKVLVFKQEKTTYQREVKPELNAVKFGVFDAVYGSYSLFYERALNKHFAMEAGLGATYSDRLLDITPDGIDIIRNYSFSNTRDYFTFKYGTAFSLQVKYYLSEVFEEFYFSGGLNYRKYDWDFFPNGDRGITMRKTESLRFSGPQVNVGYAWIYDSGFFLDGNLGVSFSNYETILYDAPNDRLVTDTYTKPEIRIGLKVGFIF
jgi:hypothetical protein